MHKEFAIRNDLGNLTDIGRKMGMRCRDKRISVFSPKAEVIHDYLHRLAWKYARSLVPGGANIEDRTGYIQNIN